MYNINDQAVWSYSIYGENVDCYYSPVLVNIRIARKNNAKIVISTTDEYEEKVRNFFRDFLDEIIIITYRKVTVCNHPKVLRFIVSERVQSKFYFFKDSDSIVTQVETEIMEHWMANCNSEVLIVRDHPLHVAPIMAGMFGVSSKVAKYLANSTLYEFDSKRPRFLNNYSYDQDWLMNVIYPIFVKFSDVYSSFLFYSGERGYLIPRSKSGFDFIGAQTHINYPARIEDNEFYGWYGDGLLCAPSYLRYTFFFGKVRPTIIAAFIYSKVTNWFGVNPIFLRPWLL